MDFTRHAIIQFLLFCSHLEPLGSGREGTREDFLELYLNCAGQFADEIEEVVVNCNFKKWKPIAPQGCQP